MLYGLVIFLGAFLLFQVQPLIAKVILPWFGGSAAVWLTCLTFFQVALLLGYLYAHLLTHKIPPRVRPWLHVGLLLVSCLFLPILPNAVWKPLDPGNPGLRIALVLAATVGLPYFLLAATSPLVQAWYAEREGDQPYRFFAVSNAGSLLGLLSYPTLAEPYLSTRHQAWAWSGTFAAFCLLLAFLALRPSKGAAAAAVASDEGSSLPPAPDRTARILWIALPACASLLLLAVTNHLTQNVAPFPFLWVLPLSLYLLSFVFTFGRRSRYTRRSWMQLLAVALGGMAYGLGPNFANSPLVVTIPIFASGFFVCCMFCHGELARLKPGASQLTSYYLMLSLGGALGGMFVSVLAPMIYSGYFEMHVGLCACGVLALLVLRQDPQSPFHASRRSPVWLVLVVLLLGLTGGLIWTVRENLKLATLSMRNFYGTLKVMDIRLPKVMLQVGTERTVLPEEFSARKLIHGTIDHGVQYHDERRRKGTAYYIWRSGVALAIRDAHRNGPIRVGVVGLGTGTIAALVEAGDVIRFYEINPQVVTIAHKEFTYLEDTAAKVEIVPGDARLVMEREPAQNYDVFAVDAFSGDSIPVHLLTIECFREYFRHIKPGGALVIHISNTHLDLQPVVQKAAEVMQKRAVVVESMAFEPLGQFRALWVVITDRAELFDDPDMKKFGGPLEKRPDLRLWTDDYSNLLQVLKRIDFGF